MAEPISAGAIAALAFQKFIESGAGVLATKFTTEAIAKMDLLLKRIWTKFQDKPLIEELRVSIDETQKITAEQINQIASYLQVAMDEDPQFSNEINAIANEINAGKMLDKSNMTQINHDQSKGYQLKVEGGVAYIGENHIHRQAD